MQKTPEQWLEETAPSKERGLFKVFLGYAPGVGKTGRSAFKGWKRYLYWSAIHRFLRDAPAVDVHIVTQEAR